MSSKLTKIGKFAPGRGRLLEALPLAFSPYAELIRIHKPHGIFMAMFTHLLGLLYANTVRDVPSQFWSTIQVACRLLLWVVLCRSGACAWNDVLDQDYDRQTTRCRNRPIARGALSTKDGCIAATVLMVLALLSLRDLPQGCIQLGYLAVTMSAIYPLAKRFTDFPQLLLGAIAGLTVALSAYAGSVAALSNPLWLPTTCLMATVCLLMVFYDVLYAQADISDDIKSGVRGMAVLFRHRIPLLLGAIACGAAGLTLWLGTMIHAGPGFFLLALGGPSLGFVPIITFVQLGYQGAVKSMGALGFLVAFISLMGAFVVQGNIGLIVEGTL